MEPGGSERYSGLIAAADREARAAAGLAGCLRRLRAAAQHVRAPEVEARVQEARRAAGELEQAGAARGRRTAQAGRALGLGPAPTLAEVAARAGRPELAEAARRLARSLDEVAREAACAAICARFGAAVAGHLAGLAGAGNGYGPSAGPPRPGSALARRV